MRKQTAPSPKAAAPVPSPKASPPTIACHDPATLEPLGEVPALSRAEVKDRVQRAQKAQRAWGQTSFAERRRVLRLLLDYIIEHQAEICRLCSRDSGKTLADAAMGEIFPVCEKVRYLIDHGEADLRPEARPSGLLMHKAARVVYQPLGVVGVICPWNFPFHNIFCPTVPALFAGNAVIAKVSEWTAWSAAEFQAMFDAVLDRAGYPRDLVQIITGDGETSNPVFTTLSGCFVATAAYGSQLEPEVATLRRFRDRYLMDNPLGQVLVGSYYAMSPPLAGVIAQNESLRALAQQALAPVVQAVKALDAAPRSR